MPKIAFVGAGSAVFTRNLVGDILSLPELRDDTEFALMDIDAERLRTAEIVTDAADRGARRRRHGRGHHGPPRGAGRRRLRRHLVPGRRLQAVDGGRLRGAQALRAAPDDRRHARRSAGSCAGCARSRCCSTSAATSRSCQPGRAAAQLRQPDGDAVLGGGRGRARSAPSGSATPCRARRRELAARPRAARGELDYHVAGINHIAFFLRLEHEGEDLYPALREVDAAGLATASATRCSSTSATSSPSPRSTSPSTSPWFIKDGRAGPDRALQRPAGRVPAPLRAPDRRVGGDARASSRRWELDTERSHEYGADIIRACETGEPFTFNGNVPNRWEDGLLIDNLPADCCVEVPCVASARGIEPQPVGALPRQLAALMQTNVNVQGLTVEAALTGRREAVYQAAMLDPHTAAELSLDEIAALVDDLLEAHGEWIPALGERRDVRMSTGQPREDAKIAFDRERRRRALVPAGFADALRGRRRLAHAPVRGGRRPRSAPRAARRSGEQVIPLDSIVGTVDRRRGEFDRAFRPSPEHPRALGADRRGAQARRGDAADRRLPDRRPATSSRTATTASPWPARWATRTSTPTSSRCGPSSAPTASCRCADLPLKAHERVFHERVPLPPAARERIQLSDEWRYAQLATLIESWGYRASPGARAADATAREMALSLVPRGVRADGRRCCARRASAAAAPRPSATCASRCCASCCCSATTGPRTWPSGWRARSSTRAPAAEKDTMTHQIIKEMRD